MKKTLILLLSTVLLISCNGQKEKLELKLTKGVIYIQKMISIVSIIQTIDGREFNMKIAIMGKMTFKVTDIQDSFYNLEARYENLSMKMTLPNGVMDFSSEKNDDKDIFSSILGAMKNKPFLVKMTRLGKVSEVKNIDSVFSLALDKFPQLTDIQRQQEKEQLMKSYGEKAFKGNLEMVSAIFSDLPVAKGDKWVVNTQLESGMAGKMTTTYEFKELNDSYCRILGDSKIVTADKEAYIQANGMPVKYDMTGTMTSDIKINKKTGWTMEAKISQTIKGTTYVKDNPQMPGGMAIPITMVNEMTITEK